MKFLALSFFALSIFGATKATHCIPKSGTKHEICQALSDGGVINVSALNCPKVKIAPVIDILRKRTLKGLPFCIPGEEEPPSHGGGGGNGGNGGNNGGNGGGGSSGSPPEDGDEDCPPEEGSTPGSPGSPGSPGGGDDDGDCCKSQEDICSTASKAGLLNLDILGCVDFDFSPTLNIGKRHRQHRLEYIRSQV